MFKHYYLITFVDIYWRKVYAVCRVLRYLGSGTDAKTNTGYNPDPKLLEMPCPDSKFSKTESGSEIIKNRIRIRPKKSDRGSELCLYIPLQDDVFHFNRWVYPWAARETGAGQDPQGGRDGEGYQKQLLRGYHIKSKYF